MGTNSLPDGSRASRASSFFKNRTLFAIFITIVAYITLTTILFFILLPEQFDLKTGDIATKTIVATKDVVDEYTTSINRENAANSAEKRYSGVTGAKEESLAKLNAIFDEMEEIRATGEAIKYGTGKMAQESQDPPRPAVTRNPNGAIPSDQYQAAAQSFAGLRMSSWQMNILMNLSEQELSSIRRYTQAAVQTVMEGTVVADRRDGIISGIQRDLQNNMSFENCLNIAMPVVRECVVSNMVVDEDLSAQAREKAWNEVEPSYYKQGQNIVTAGSRVTEQQIQLMISLGLINGNAFDRVLFGGVALLIALILIIFAVHLNTFERSILGQPKLLLVMLSISLVSLLLSFVLQNISPYLAPLSIGALLAVSTLNPSAAFAFNIFNAVMVGFVAKGSGTFSQQMMHVVVHGIMGGALGIYVLSRHSKRLSVLLAGAFVAFFNLVSMFALGFITNNNMDSILRDALFSFGGGLIAAVLTLGFQPIFELVFNLITPSKLLELANPNQPLLRRLMIEAPGTYQHSLMVANLAEAAANEIGANALLVRVGAYYHDIGKLSHPHFFKENQLGENPHDKLEPEESANIILQHVPEGAAIAQKTRLPVVIRDLIRQHHGDTPVIYFYTQELKKNPNADISRFRYHEPRPKTTEAAILLLADSVEAAIRSMRDHSGEKIEQGIKVILQQKMADGQLDDAPIRFKDLSLICKAFAQALNGMYHQRIEYPNFDLRKEAQTPDSSILQLKKRSIKPEFEKPVKTDSSVTHANTPKESAQTDLKSIKPIIPIPEQKPAVDVHIEAVNPKQETAP
ncbi:MAG: HDIG domain-containing protein [Oscillospiraceae bacterium]|jgi:putative nucleotidyltransferase with HDIG domain|nr:HDIG domain-containing protein [Oscillospiraceae bacterium]